MTDEPKELTEEELEDLSAEALPDREAISFVTPVGDSLGPPPLDDSAPPVGGDET